jgi:Mg-chelatase subunit ChlD
MSRKDFTDITLVVDRSGSMSTIKEDAQGGVNSFIADQAKEPGDSVFTLVQFDTEYELIHKGVPTGDVPKYELHPRGMTALLDAVGKAINETGERLAAINEEQRPELVVFVVMTDGLENSSMEFTKPQIKEMISRQQDEYNWHFTFLGANQDAFAEGREIGVKTAGIANFNVMHVNKAMGATSDKVKRMRAAVRGGASGQSVSNDFTDEEREGMK